MSRLGALGALGGLGQAMLNVSQMAMMKRIQENKDKAAEARQLAAEGRADDRANARQDKTIAAADARQNKSLASNERISKQRLQSKSTSGAASDEDKRLAAATKRVTQIDLQLAKLADGSGEGKIVDSQVAALTAERTTNTDLIKTLTGGRGGSSGRFSGLYSKGEAPAAVAPTGAPAPTAPTGAPAPTLSATMPGGVPANTAPISGLAVPPPPPTVAPPAPVIDPITGLPANLLGG